jgi:hypothetical protein
MTKGECMAMLAVAAKAYGREVTEGTIGVWAEFMGDITPEEGVRAVREHIADSPHFPAVADVRKRVAAYRAPQVDPGSAWAEVRRAICRVGCYGNPTWSAPAVAHAVDALGWVTICHTDEDDVPTLRAQFERYLKGYLDGERRAANVGALERHHEERRGALAAGQVVAALVPAGGRK